MENLEIEEEEAQGNEEPTGCSTGGIVTFCVGLVAGTFSALICKGAYDTSSYGTDGITKPFAKPIMMLLLMFSGMIPAIFFWYIQQYLFTEKKNRDIVEWKTLMILIVPCLCDLMCTLLLLVAQLYITASLWQMMRGTVIIITAVLKSRVLHIKLKRHMWAGVFVITIAMILVASTSFFTPPTTANTVSSGNTVTDGNMMDQYALGNSHADAPAAAVAVAVVPPKDPRIGILLVVIGCLAQGVQCKLYGYMYNCV